MAFSQYPSGGAENDGSLFSALMNLMNLMNLTTLRVLKILKILTILRILTKSTLVISLDTVIDFCTL